MSRGECSLCPQLSAPSLLPCGGTTPGPGSFPSSACSSRGQQSAQPPSARRGDKGTCQGSDASVTRAEASPPVQLPQTEPREGASTEQHSGRWLCTMITSVLLCVLHRGCLSFSTAVVVTVVTITAQPGTHGFIHSNKEAPREC